MEWEGEAGAQAGAPTLTAAGLLLAGVDGLALRDASDGSELARVALPAAIKREAVVASDTIYVVDESGGISALRPSGTRP